MARAKEGQLAAKDVDGQHPRSQKIVLYFGIGMGGGLLHPARHQPVLGMGEKKTGERFFGRKCGEAIGHVTGQTTNPQRLFKSAKAFEAWLKKHHARSDGLWLQIAKRGADELVTGTVEIACVNMTTMTPAPIPDFLYAKLEALK